MASLTLLAQDPSEGVQQYESGNYNEAERTLRSAVQKNSEDAKALSYLGLTLIAKGKTSEAAPLLEKADSLSPSEQSKLGLARVYIERKDPGKAEDLINQAAEMNSDSNDVPYYRGLLQISQGKFEEGAEQLENATERNPNNAYAHYYAGLAYNSLKRTDKVIEHFDKFLKLAPQAPEAKKVQSIMKSAR